MSAKAALALICAIIAALAGAARAQPVTMPNGEIVQLNDLPLVRKFEGTFKVATTPFLIVWSSPPNCPSSWSSSTAAMYGIAGAVADREARQASCSKRTWERLEGYEASTLKRCECIRVLEGTSHRALKAFTEFVNDPYYYSNVTIFVSKGKAREKLRGILAFDLSGRYRILNERQQLICSGTGRPEGGDLEFSCFGDQVKAKGTYRRISHLTSTSRFYGLGTFQLTDGSRLDIAANIIASDLAKLHPNFPD